MQKSFTLGEPLAGVGYISVHPCKDPIFQLASTVLLKMDHGKEEKEVAKREDFWSAHLQTTVAPGPDGKDSELIVHCCGWDGPPICEIPNLLQSMCVMRNCIILPRELWRGFNYSAGGWGGTVNFSPFSPDYMSRGEAVSLYPELRQGNAYSQIKILCFSVQQGTF